MCTETKINVDEINNFLLGDIEFYVDINASILDNVKRISGVLIEQSVSHLSTDCHMNIQVCNDELNVIAQANLSDICTWLTDDAHLEDDGDPIYTLESMKKVMQEQIDIIDSKLKSIEPY